MLKETVQATADYKQYSFIMLLIQSWYNVISIFVIQISFILNMLIFEDVMEMFIPIIKKCLQFQEFSAEITTNNMLSV